MARKTFGPRKQRTRQHVIADLSAHHVEKFILEEGHTAWRLTPDYGYDLVVFTYDEQGYLEPGSIYVQLKAAETLRAAGPYYVFDLDVRDYNLLAHLQVGSTSADRGRGTVKRADVTYGQLDKALRSLGFSCRVVQEEPPALHYEHPETGAFLTVPPFPENDRVWEHHLVTARVMLDEFGIADPTAFDARLRRAG